MRWEPEEKLAPDWFVMCHECREPVDPHDYDKYFDMCVGCRDEKGLDEEEDRKTRKRPDLCVVCRMPLLDDQDVDPFRQGEAHWACIERFHDTLELEHDMKKSRGES